MMSGLSLFVLTLLLVFQVNANPLDVQREGGSGVLSKFDEVEDMNDAEKNTMEIDTSKTSYLPHRDGDEPVMSINLNDLPNLKYDVEILESEDLKKETDEVEEHFRGAALYMDRDLFTDEDIEMHKLNDPRSISIMGLMIILTVFGIVILIIYAVLMTWRQKLEQRYGQRVLLVSRCDDDDYRPQITSSSVESNNLQ